MALEALVLLAAFRAALAVIPVRRILKAVCRGSTRSVPEANQPLSVGAVALALRVRWAVEAAARNSPVEFVCFPQSLAAYVMLRRRGVSSTIVYGVARSPAGELIAHTWLTAGDERAVVGGEGSETFQPIERWT